MTHEEFIGDRRQQFEEFERYCRQQVRAGSVHVDQPERTWQRLFDLWSEGQRRVPSKPG